MEIISWGSYEERTLFLDFMSFSLDQPVTKTQILNYSVHLLNVVIAIEKRRFRRSFLLSIGTTTLEFSNWFLVNGWSNEKYISADGNTQMPLSLKHHSTPPSLHLLNHHIIFLDNIGREFIQGIGNLLNTTTTCYVCFKLLRVPRCPICGARHHALPLIPDTGATVDPNSNFQNQSALFQILTIC